MKEYKDSEEIKRQLRIWIQECEDWLEHKEAGCFRDCIDLLDEIPAADVVEVVRCKDCKYYAAMITDTVSGNMETAPWGICTQPWFNSDEYDVQENGYCSYGKRKMDKEE